MASNQAVRLTTEQVLEAILNSDEDQSDLESLSDDFSSDDSCLGDIIDEEGNEIDISSCLLYTSPSPRDKRQSRMPSSA